jgi:hypothetical protein
VFTPKQSVDDIVDGQRRGYNADERKWMDWWSHRLLVIPAVGADTSWKGRGLHGTRAGAVPRSHDAAPADPLAEVLPVLAGLESFRNALIPTFVAGVPSTRVICSSRRASALGKLAACR